AQQVASPVRGGGFGRTASLTRAVAGKEGVLDGPEEFHVFRTRFPGGTGGKAENAGGADGSKEEAIVSGVRGQKSLLHFGARRQLHHAGSVPVERSGAPPKNR